MRAFLLCILLTPSFLANGQSPWVAGKGKGYVQVGFTSIGPYQELFQSDGGSYRLSHVITDRTLQFFGEYGVADHTSILASVPFKFLTQGEGFDPFFPATRKTSFSTIGNIQIAARHNFTDEKFLLSTQWTLEIPTAGFDELNSIRGGLNAYSLIPSMSIGKGFSNFYAFASTGFAVRTNNYSSDFRVGAEAGYKVIDRIYLILVLDIVESLKNGSVFEDLTLRRIGLYLNNQSYFAYGIKTIIGFTDKLGINGAFYGARSGNLVARSPSLNLGAYYKW
ncbi:MAG: hypothetical protein R2820_14820 [Cyclobacteriaceae bacterium]|nr:hypothetical protein [Cyclobacteriaceae bacterium]